MKRKNEMKIKYAMFENKQYFDTIVKLHKSDKLSVMDAYRLNRLVKKLDELNTEYTELKQKIFTQYGKPGEKEGEIVIGPENREAFVSEYNELSNIEHDLETEMLAFPSKLEDGFSAADLNIMELFFDLSGLDEKEKPKKEDEPEKSSDNED